MSRALLFGGIFSLFLSCVLAYSNVTCPTAYCFPNGTACTAEFLASPHAVFGFDYAQIGGYTCCKNTSILLICRDDFDLFDFRHKAIASCTIGTFFEVSDVILTMIGGIDCFLMLVVTIFVIAHRSYLPLRVTNVPLMATSTFGAIMWFFATVVRLFSFWSMRSVLRLIDSQVTNEHFQRDPDSFWGICNLWSCEAVVTVGGVSFL